jgi:hypothetical protein
MSTLEHLFADDQRIPELDEIDFRDLLEIVIEDAERRGYGIDVYRQPPIAVTT